MAKVLRYKSEGCWFDPSWCQWIFHWHKILPITLWPWGRLSLQQKWVPGVYPEGKGGWCIRLTTYHHPVSLSRNLGTLTSWNPLGLSRSVMGLLYLYPCTPQIMPKIAYMVMKKCNINLIFFLNPTIALSQDYRVCCDSCLIVCQ